MRPITNFTLHAVLAAALTALAAASAAAGGATEHYFTITLTEGRVDATQSPAGRNEGRVQSFEIQQWSFDGVAKVDGFTVKQGVKPYEPTLDPAYVTGWQTSAGAAPPPPRGGVTVASGDVNDNRPGRGGSNEMRTEDSSGTEKMQRGGTGSSQSMTIGGGRTEARTLPRELPVMASETESTASGQATGKRQHMPIRSRSYYDQANPPPGPGTLTVRGAFPGCKVGARYPQAEIGDGSVRFIVDGVTVTSCGSNNTSAAPTENITFVYGKLVVK